MSHRKLDTTKQYYRIGEQRRREAVDRVAAMAFDRHGNRIWRQAQALLDSGHARRAIGQVAVPFGSAPNRPTSKPAAKPARSGFAAPARPLPHRRLLPARSAGLPRRPAAQPGTVLATTETDQWARAEAIPSDEEIRRIRRLITRIRTGLDELTPEQREHIEQAITVVRRHRSVMLGMPRVRQALPDLRPERTA